MFDFRGRPSPLDRRSLLERTSFDRSALLLILPLARILILVFGQKQSHRLLLLRYQFINIANFLPLLLPITQLVKFMLVAVHE